MLDYSSMFIDVCNCESDLTLVEGIKRRGKKKKNVT